MTKTLLCIILVLISTLVKAQIIDVVVYDDCSKNGYTKVIGAPEGVEVVDLGLKLGCRLLFVRKNVESI